jgi:hypothetical protein
MDLERLAKELHGEVEVDKSVIEDSPNDNDTSRN